MSSELERRLEGMLAAAPEPEPGVGEEAMQRALQAVRPATPARRGLRTAVLVFAATFVLLALAAGALAAAGALHVSFGSKTKQQRPPTTELSLPKGANGVAAIVDGRLSVVIKGGFRLQGLRVTAAALSPHALYVAAGIGHSLVAVKPDGGTAWSHPTGGTVVSIAWAPDGLRIAYIVRSRRGLGLHVIWGNGRHDTTVDRSVRAVRPSWRGDSLAFAYVGGGGKAIVYDLGHQSRSVLGMAAPVTHVAFSPVGRTLLVATPGSVLLGGKTVATGEVEANRLAPRPPGGGARKRRRAGTRPDVRIEQPSLRGLSGAGQSRRLHRRPRRDADAGEDSRRLAGEKRRHAPRAETDDLGRRSRSRLAGPGGNRDVARLRRDLRRPEPVQVAEAELAHLPGEERRRDDERAVGA